MAFAHLLQIGDQVALGYTDDGERGILTRIKNGTGVASVRGSVAAESASADDAFILQSNEFDAYGIVAEDGIADGDMCWVWKNGSRCKVLYKNATAATRGRLALCADTDGRAIDIAVPTTSPSEGQHFKEIGHVCESKDAGTDVLVLCEIHFN